MKLQFKLYKLKDKNNLLKKSNSLNEFIVIDESHAYNQDCFRVRQITKSGLIFAENDNLITSSILIPQEKLFWDGYTYVQFDIPKNFLSLNIIDSIFKLNNED